MLYEFIAMYRYELVLILETLICINWQELCKGVRHTYPIEQKDIYKYIVLRGNEITGENGKILAMRSKCKILENIQMAILLEADLPKKELCLRDIISEYKTYIEMNEEHRKNPAENLYPEPISKESFNTMYNDFIDLCEDIGYPYYINEHIEDVINAYDRAQ